MSCGSKVEIWANSFDEILEKLRDHEINTCTKYVCTKSPSSFKTNNQVTRNDHDLQEENSRTYQKEKINKNKSLDGGFADLFILPELSDHKNHVIGDSAAVIEPVDSRIREYVQQGKRNAKTIKELIEVYCYHDRSQTKR
ncbi:hypothetical protein JTE90_002093 [Oedothorax gibbosus]|uniref:Uncharacterized protein n=1 Tax=Oedothorax gibbosus TaxID=931172 RepID=A0AAV6V6A2_9ARAC|nr:hypothetical protein JTE90_002093 [Oedothorax gibbosus]